MPFIGTHTRGGKRVFAGYWCVEVPENMRDAQQLGRDMAPAFLRAEPSVGNRQAGLGWLSAALAEGPRFSVCR